MLYGKHPTPTPTRMYIRSLVLDDSLTRAVVSPLSCPLRPGAQGALGREDYEYIPKGNTPARDRDGQRQ